MGNPHKALGYHLHRALREAALASIVHCNATIRHRILASAPLVHVFVAHFLRELHRLRSCHREHQRVSKRDRAEEVRYHAERHVLVSLRLGECGANIVVCLTPVWTSARSEQIHVFM